ncbi:MAG: hypothetical protein COV46_06390 [Deltaproteobacteria bacterium CG11_big_fil_rev_8_21_14_0_20_49_13]|nr:MAG: hypothetical protein COV46_06390 [Deltaproteobacteria bacterium CG11_big_fil_rev_8_21_14_0_20_49_13]
MTKTMNLLSNKERTFWVYPIIEGGAGTGFGGGVGIRHTDLFHRHYLLGASYTIHIDMSQGADVSFAKPEAFELFEKPVSYSAGAGFNRGLLNNYYGIGNNSSENNNAIYGSNDVEVGATLTYEPIDNFLLSPYFGFSIGNSMSKGSGSSTPGVETIFPPAEIDGFGKWVNYADIGIRIANDTRNSVELTQRGGLRAFTFRNFYGLNRSGYNYNQYELDVRQFFPLWIPRQVLLLRCNFVGKIPTDGNEIPFWRMATLDVNSPLRGFSTGRFNDRA